MFAMQKLQVLVLTVEEIRAMAAGKPQGVFWAIATHTAAHFDEIWGFFQLKMWGQHKHPGISNAIFICLLDADNTTWQELLALGVVPVGIGGKDNPYDEHGRINEEGNPLFTCASELVTFGYYPPKKDVEGHREYLTNPDKRGLELLNRHKFFRSLGLDPEVYIHSIATLTEYALKVDRRRVLDVHAAPNDIKDEWATWEDITRGKLELPSDLKLPEGNLPSDPRAAANVVAKNVVETSVYMLWLYLTRGIAFANCLKQVVRRRIEWRKFHIDGIKPPIRMAVIPSEHPLSGNRELPRVLRHLGADVIYKRSPEGHVFIGIRENIWKYEDEDQMEPETDYREEKDLKRKRINIELSLRGILVGLRRLEFAHYRDTTERTEAELARNSVEGSVLVTPALKAGYLLGGGSTQAGQGGKGWPLDDAESLEVIETELQGKILETPERKDGTRSLSRRERMEVENVFDLQPDKAGKIPVASF